MCCGSDFNSVCARFPYCISKALWKRDFLDIYLTIDFGFRNFQNISPMRAIFLWKCSKFYQDLKNGEQNLEKVFLFRDDCIWIGRVNLSLPRREYFWPAVNVLKSSPKILPITKRDFFELNCLHIDQ